MRIIGIDPGLKATGYGIIDVTDTSIDKAVLIEAGFISPKQRDLLPVKIDNIYLNLKKTIERCRPQVMVLEKIYSHHQYPTTAYILGHVRGAICLLCSHCGLNLAEHSVKRIRKAIVGNGSASKQQTLSAVAHILKIDGRQLTLDASDALALALGYAHMNRQSLSAIAEIAS